MAEIISIQNKIDSRIMTAWYDTNNALNRKALDAGEECDFDPNRGPSIGNNINMMISINGGLH